LTKVNQKLTCNSSME